MNGHAALVEYAAWDRRVFHQRPIHLAIVGAVLLLLVVAVALRVYEPADSQAGIAVGCGFVVLALMSYARYGLKVAWLSATSIYLMLFWMFHFGLSFTAVFVPDVLRDYYDYDPEITWLYAANTRLAMLLGAIGAAGFVAGAGLFTPGGAVTRLRRPAYSGDPTLYVLGWILMVLGMLTAVALLLQRGGLGIFSMGYLPFRVNVLATTSAPLAIDASQLGCAFAICGAPRRRCLAPLAVWSMLGVLMLILGLRSEAMIPLVTFTVILTHRGVRLPRSAVTATVVALLFIIPAIKTFRLVGFSNRSTVAWMEASPLGTFTELGGTLRAVKAYVDWIEEGDAYQSGATYWAPVDRQVISRLIPGRTVLPPDKDARLPSRNISTVGSIGLAATGEAYYNFGVAGPFLYYALVGALFGWLEHAAWRTPHRTALLAIVMLVMFFNIRGEWLPVPGRLGLGAALLWTCHLLGRPERSLGTPSRI